MLTEGTEGIKKTAAFQDAISKGAISLGVAGAALVAWTIGPIAIEILGFSVATHVLGVGGTAMTLAWGSGVAFEGVLIPVGAFFIGIAPLIFEGALALAPALAAIAAVGLALSLGAAVYFGIKAVYIHAVAQKV